MHKIGEARKQVDYECDVNSDEIRQRMKGAMILYASILSMELSLSTTT